MRLAKTPTGKTLFITGNLWVHWFHRSQRLWYVWGLWNGALHTPLFMAGYRPLKG